MQSPVVGPEPGFGPRGQVSERSRVLCGRGPVHSRCSVTSTPRADGAFAVVMRGPGSRRSPPTLGAPGRCAWWPFHGPLLGLPESSAGRGGRRAFASSLPLPPTLVGSGLALPYPAALSREDHPRGGSGPPLPSRPVLGMWKGLHTQSQTGTQGPPSLPWGQSHGALLGVSPHTQPCPWPGRRHTEIGTRPACTGARTRTRSPQAPACPPAPAAD